MNSKLTAIVTGANRGIGAAVVQQLVERDYAVFLGSRNLDAGMKTANAISHAIGGDVTAIQLDVTDQASVDNAAAVVRDRSGYLDVLVNNAGAFYDNGQSVVDADLTIVQNALDVNLLGAWRMTQAMLPLLRKGTRRRIVNVSSQGGSIADMQADHPAYRVSKAGLNALTRMFAIELEAEAILVNAICPGWTATEMGDWGGHSVEVGAGYVLQAVDFEDDGPTGGFFRGGERLQW